jgi:hypothetical protein|tara:strand:+ start:1985 stop:2326 length:342 start_codon:yes stop_codon:yes gene_type:complete
MATQPLPKSIRELCTPSALYFVLSFIALIIISIQNLGNTNKFCVGEYSCNVPSTILVFVVQSVYILFFTWVLNLICKEGYKNVSWFLVLLPFIMFFVLLAIMMMYAGAELAMN